MLRHAVRAFAAMCLLGAVAATIWQPVEWPLLVVPGLVVLGTFYERRYTQMATPPAVDPTDFRPSAERFVDPETGRVTIVLTDPRTGARRYVEAGEPS